MNADNYFKFSNEVYQIDSFEELSNINIRIHAHVVRSNEDELLCLLLKENKKDLGVLYQGKSYVIFGVDSNETGISFKASRWD